MKARYAVIIATLMLLFSFSLAMAEDSVDSGELDATMRLMDDAEAESSQAVTRPIELPDAASIIAVGESENGLDAANAGGENALRNANEQARDRAAAIVEAAKDNRESHGRSEELPDPPNRPDPPNPG